LKRQAVVINTSDNVATAVINLSAGTTVKYFIGQNEAQLKIVQDIPFGHKFAINPIDIDNEIVKYGESIGSATEKIKVGEHVHVHNMQSKRGRGDWK